jgi:hypothetical protein
MKLADKVQRRKASLLTVGGNPNLSTQELAALRPDWFNGLNRSNTINLRNSQESKYSLGLDRHLRQRFGSNPSDVYMSLTPYLCLDNKTCLLSVGNKFLYPDDHHLSPFGHELFFQPLVDRLQGLATLAANPLPP